MRKLVTRLSLSTLYQILSRAKLTHLAFIQARSTEVRYPWYSWLGFLLL